MAVGVTLEDGTMVDDQMAGQYFQYRAFFATESCKLTPRLSGVRVSVSS